ncbi:MAG: Mpo1-like protein [Pseudomonadota bacterium]
MKSFNNWLQDYEQRHRNPVNRTLNWICLPQTAFAIWLGLKCIPLGNDLFNVATVAALGTWLLYFRLSRPLAFGMVMVLCALYAGVIAVEALAGRYAPWLALAIFAEAWISQLIGRDVEGARPTLVEDLRFLLIGPLWLLADVYRGLGWPVQSAGDKSAIA